MYYIILYYINMLKAGSRALAAGSETRKGGVSRPGPPGPAAGTAGDLDSCKTVAVKLSP